MTTFRLRNLGIAGVLAAAAAVLIGVYVTSYRNQVQSGANLVSVYVATRDIPEDTEAKVYRVESTDEPTSTGVFIHAQRMRLL